MMSSLTWARLSLRTSSAQYGSLGRAVSTLAETPTPTEPDTTGGEETDVSAAITAETDNETAPSITARRLGKRELFITRNEFYYYFNIRRITAAGQVRLSVPSPPGSCTAGFQVGRPRPGFHSLMRSPPLRRSTGARVGSADEAVSIRTAGDDLRNPGGGQHSDPMAPSRESGSQLARKGFLDHQLIWKPLMMDARLCQRLCRTPPEIQHAHQFENDLGNDLGSASRAESDNGLARLQHKRRRHARKRPFASGNGIGLGVSGEEMGRFFLEHVRLPIRRRAMRANPAGVIRIDPLSQVAGVFLGHQAARHVHEIRSEERRVGKECRSRWS